MPATHYEGEEGHSAPWPEPGAMGRFREQTLSGCCRMPAMRQVADEHCLRPCLLQRICGLTNTMWRRPWSGRW